MNLHPFIMISTHHKYPLLFLRAEKEKSQYFSELNDLRSSTNHLANDKVEEVAASKYARTGRNYQVVGYNSEPPIRQAYSSIDVSLLSQRLI